jgi:purine-nucleoside phosphorylase
MNAMFSLADYDEAANFIRSRSRHQPVVGLVLGSGLSALARLIEVQDVIPYEEIPHFPVSTVQGHAGRLVIGVLAGVTVCAMQGRFHFYEGYSMQQVTFPIRVMERMGITTVVLTNAAGGINRSFAVGDIMLIEDHINFVGMAGMTPLLGPNLEEFGPRFPAMNRTYTPELRALARRVAAAQGVELKRGVYAGGMSTVPEALIAHHAGMQVLAFSTITNMTVDELDMGFEPSHADVIDAGVMIVPRLTALLLGVLETMAGS